MEGSGDEAPTQVVRTISETSVVSTTSREEVTIPTAPRGLNLNLNLRLPTRQEPRLEDVGGVYQYPIVIPVEAIPVISINNERCCCAQMIQQQQQQKQRCCQSRKECPVRREENVVYMPLSFPDPYCSQPAYQDEDSCPCSGIGTCKRVCVDCCSRYVKNWKSPPKCPSTTTDPIYLQRLYKSLKTRSPTIKNGLATVRNQAKHMSYLLKGRTMIESEDIPAIAGEIKSFQEKLEDARQLTEDLSRGVYQVPPPPPRKDDRFYINESSTYRPGPWPAQTCPLVPPLASRVKKELIDLAAEVSELEHEMARLQVALEERKSCRPEDDLLREECPPCREASQKTIKKRKPSRIEIKDKGRGKPESYDIREPIRIPSRILNPDALKDVEDTTCDVITKFNSRLCNYRSCGPRY